MAKARPGLRLTSWRSTSTGSEPASWRTRSAVPSGCRRRRAPAGTPSRRARRRPGGRGCRAAGERSAPRRARARARRARPGERSRRGLCLKPGPRAEKPGLACADPVQAIAEPVRPGPACPARGPWPAGSRAGTRPFGRVHAALAGVLVAAREVGVRHEAQLRPAPRSRQPPDEVGEVHDAQVVGGPDVDDLALRIRRVQDPQRRRHGVGDVGEGPRLRARRRGSASAGR